MKKTLLLATAVLLTAATLQARTQQQARQIAAGMLAQPKVVAISPSLYIYNNEEKPGFAIISQSDKLRPIIGYSDTDTLDMEHLPSNLSNWLKWVEEATAYVELHPECALTEAQRAAQTDAVSPLLGSIAWGQDAPYNSKCPNSSPAGCVATAAAQCVYYHRYPDTGTGSHTDASQTSLTVDFSKVTYDYSLMFDRYSTSTTYTAAQLAEVAELTYHCGVMSDMDYGTEQSSASILAMRRGLVENLGYDPGCEVVQRACYTYDEWQSLLQNELAQGRPVPMAGTCNNGTEGHCFVIDGLNSNGLYHVNWGWTGAYNGYYDIAILNPEGTGIGASYSDDGFCSDQFLLVQMAPKGTLTDASYIPSLASPEGQFTLSTTSAALGSTVTAGLTKLYNYSLTAAVGRFGLAFVQDGQVVTTAVCNMNAMTFSASSDSKIYGGSVSNLSVTLPATLADGTYQVYAAFFPTSGDFSGQCGLLHFRATVPSYYTCTVKNRQATFSRSSCAAKVSATDWSFDDAPVRAGSTQTVSCTLTNLDQENTLVGRYFLKVTSPSNSEDYIEADKVLTLAPGASGELTFQHNFDETGQWSSQLCIFYQNIDYDAEQDRTPLADTDCTFQVETDATTSAIFTLLDSPALVSQEGQGDSLFVGAPATFRLSLRNTGETYVGRFQMQLFKSTTSTTVIGTVTADIDIPADSEDTYTITGTLTQVSSTLNPALSGTTYYAKAYYDYGGTFTTFPVGNGVSNRVSIKVYAGSPATGIEAIAVDAGAAPSYNLSGQRIGQPHGLIVRRGRVCFLKK